MAQIFVTQITALFTFYYSSWHRNTNNLSAQNLIKFWR